MKVQLSQMRNQKHYSHIQLWDTQQLYVKELKNKSQVLIGELDFLMLRFVYFVLLRILFNSCVIQYSTLSLKCMLFLQIVLTIFMHEEFQLHNYTNYVRFVKCVTLKKCLQICSCYCNGCINLLFRNKIYSYFNESCHLMILHLLVVQVCMKHL